MEKFRSILSNISLGSEQLNLFIIGTISWWMLYSFIHLFVKINHKNLKDQYDTKNRIFSIIHGLYCIYVSTFDIFFNKPDKCGYTNSKFQNDLMLISCSYFLYDVISCLLLGISCLPMLFHHIFCIAGYYTSLLYNNSSTEIIRALFVAEITNPIMHLREILKNFGLFKTKLYLTFDLIYMVKYIFSRLGYGSFVIFFTVFCNGNLIIVKISGAFVWLQSVYFAFRMIKIFKFRKKEYKERKVKGIQMWWFDHNKKIDEMEIYKKKCSKIYVP